MADITIDAKEVHMFGVAMAGAPAKFQRRVANGLNSIATMGRQAAQKYAPKETGALAAAIQEREIASVGAMTASYSVWKTSAMPYTFQREYGGTIHARSGGWLKFHWPGHGWFMVKSVTQRGSRFMGKSADYIRPKFVARMEKIVAAALAELGG